MKLNLLVSTSQINSKKGRLLGTGTVEGLRHLAETMVECGIHGDIYDLPNGSRNPTIASPFSLNNGFALTTDELNLFAIPELIFDSAFYQHLQQLHRTNQELYIENRTVSYTLKRTLLPWILEHCYSLFKKKLTSERKAAFDKFCYLAHYWLDHYALYEVIKEQKVDLQRVDYQDPTSPEIVKLKEQFKDRIDFYRYVQFLCYHQRTNVHAELRKLNIGLIVNLPFGVEFESADVFFHPEVFESGVQVGCSPEPEHGYPEQAWGVAVYKERSPGLQRYLTEKMQWLSLLGDGIFLDHLVGWCGQYVIPLEIPNDSVYPHGHFLTEDPQERVENIAWFLEIIAQSGLQIRGEVAGDAERVQAAQTAIFEFKEKGGNISAMAIPRWESEDHELKPLCHYKKHTLVMVETHDTSTMLQYLLNKKGYYDDFETPHRIREYCRRVLALPFLLKDIPLDTDNYSEEFWQELFSRLCRGTQSEDVVFTLPGLISLLSQPHRSPTIENNINVKPGTPGTVGNGWRNWSYFSPPIETMVNDPKLKQILSAYGKREYRPFDYFHDLKIDPTDAPGLEVIYAKPSGRKIVYCDEKSSWCLLSLDEKAIELIDSEIIMANTGEGEVWHHIDLETVIDLDSECFYSFQDLNGSRQCFNYSSDKLGSEKLFIKLASGQVHHFLVYKKGAIESFDFLADKRQKSN